MFHPLVAVPLVLLAVAHSVLGEREILAPLLGARWELPGIPRWAADRLLRFAWHLTSIWWLAVAGILVGASLLVAVAVAALVSALIIFVMLRGHLAWPLFLLAGLAALRGAGELTDPWLQAGAWVSAGTLAAIAGVHAYWALGGRWMLATAVPTTTTGEAPFTPGPLLTAAVAGALAALAAATVVVIAGGSGTGLGTLAQVAVGTGAAVLAFRAVGDGHYAGFTKSERSTPFGRADDAYFTPLVVVLALGLTGALITV